MSQSNNVNEKLVDNTTAIQTADTNIVTAIGDSYKTDGVTNSKVVITHEHHEIHEGQTFLISGQTTLGLGATYSILLTTPDTNKHCHLVGHVRATGEANVALYENPTGAVAGAAITAYNKNRNSADTNTTTANVLTSVTTPGTLLETQYFGSGQNVGGEGRATEEWVLKKNEEYILRVTSTSAGNDISFVLAWYEHTDLLA